MRPMLFDNATPDMKVQQEEIGAPIASIFRVNGSADIHAANCRCPFHLGASIFGPLDKARELAGTLKVGSIVINDLIAPTADPRLPFGGAGASGFGSTRGAEGLREMTRPKTMQIVGKSPRFHLKMETASTVDLVRAQLQMSHATSWRQRIKGLKNMITQMRAASRGTRG